MGVLAGLAIAALALFVGALLSAWLGLPLGLLLRAPGDRRAGLAASRGLPLPPSGGEGRS